MVALSRIFRRTPSLRTRVAFATAVAAAIVVGIVGTVVWIGITQDRKERLDRRLDEAAGFAIPFLPLGLDELLRMLFASAAPCDERVAARLALQTDAELRAVLAAHASALQAVHAATVRRGRRAVASSAVL